MFQELGNKTRKLLAKNYFSYMVIGMAALLGVAILVIAFSGSAWWSGSSYPGDLAKMINLGDSFAGGTDDPAAALISQEDLTDPADKDTPAKSSERSPSGKSKSKYGAPMSLRVPRVGIDAPVLFVGLTKKKAMAVPDSPYKLGWYKHGVYPGEVGSAVIAGHSGYSGIHAIFDDLPKLRTGDKIYVKDKKGNNMLFVVYRTKLYKPDQKVDDVFNSSDDGRYLNLITCTGSWNYRLRTHSQRLVVYAKMAQ